MELGCDARGYSRAGHDSKIWYCVILAGRQSSELNKMREVRIVAWILIWGTSRLSFPPQNYPIQLVRSFRT